MKRRFGIPATSALGMTLTSALAPGCSSDALIGDWLLISKGGESMLYSYSGTAGPVQYTYYYSVDLNLNQDASGWLTYTYGYAIGRQGAERGYSYAYRYSVDVGGPSSSGRYAITVEEGASLDCTLTGSQALECVDGRAEDWVFEPI